MNEMMRLAQERHEQIVNSIAEHQADIQKLQDEAEKLDLFFSLAKELFDSKAQRAPERPAEAPRPVASEAPRPVAPEAAHQDEGARIMPVRQPKTA